MFSRAVLVARSLASELHPNWLYRGEYLLKPKHNALAYDRTPLQHIMIYDICRGLEDYLSPDEKKLEAERLCLECVPVIHEGKIETAEVFAKILERVSVLGGQKIEGVVVKNYGMWNPEKKVLMAKYVSEYFKEKHSTEWKLSNPLQGDIIQRLIQVYRTPARWDKAIQHLRDDGALEESPRDIGKLVPELRVDLERECADEIKEALFDWAFPKVTRGVIAGFPEYYKTRLADMQWNQDVLNLDRTLEEPKGDRE